MYIRERAGIGDDAENECARSSSDRDVLNLFAVCSDFNVDGRWQEGW